MTLQECYEKMGGDYEAVFARLRQDERIIKFARLFPKDTNYDDLHTSLAAQDWPTAFRAAHSLKGVALNLGFAALGASASELTEALRNGAPTEDPAPLVEKVEHDYALIISTLEEFLAEQA